MTLIVAVAIIKRMVKPTALGIRFFAMILTIPANMIRIARLNYLAAMDTAKNVQSMSIAQMENTVMMAENVKQCAAMK